MNDIIKIIKSLENVSVLIDGATETVKHELKTKKWLFCYLVCTLDASLVQPVISSVVKDISGGGVSSALFFKQYRGYYVFQLQV